MAKVVDAVEIRPRVFYRTIQIGPVFFEEPPANDDVVEIPCDFSDRSLVGRLMGPGIRRIARGRCWSRVSHRHAAGTAGGTAIARRSTGSCSASAPVSPGGSRTAPGRFPETIKGRFR